VQIVATETMIDFIAGSSETGVSTHPHTT
jgi:hypothetical protein